MRGRRTYWIPAASSERWWPGLGSDCPHPFPVTGFVPYKSGSPFLSETIGIRGSLRTGEMGVGANRRVEGRAETVVGPLPLQTPSFVCSVF